MEGSCGLQSEDGACNSYAVRPALYLNSENVVSGDSTHTILGGSYHIVTVLTDSSAGGTVTGGGAYANEEQVPVTATPNTGYNFVNWTDENGALVSISPTYSYPMGAADEILVANFQNAPIIPTIYSCERDTIFCYYLQHVRNVNWDK